MSPRADRERGAEPHRPGLPRGVHQGAPDGVRDRVQPAREARDGGVARMTEVAEASSLPRPARAPRRSPTDLPFTFLDRAFVEALVAERGEPAWLRDDRLAALDAVRGAAGREQPPVHAVRRPAGRAGSRTPRRTPRLPRPPRRRAAAARRRRRPDRDPRGRRRGRRRSTRPSGAAGVRVLTLAELVARDEAVRPLAARRRLDPAHRREARRSCRAPPGRRASSSTSRPASAWSGRSSSAGPSGAARTLIGRTFIVLERGRAGLGRRGARRLPTRSSRARPGLLSAHDGDPPRDAARGSRWPASRSSARTTSSFQQRLRATSARARTSAGRWPSSAAGSSARGSTTSWPATGARSSRSRSCSAPRTSSTT